MFHPPLHFKFPLSTSLFTHSLPLTPSPPHTLSTSTSFPLHLTPSPPHALSTSLLLHLMLSLPLHLTLFPPHSFTHSLPLTPFPPHTHTPSLPHTLTPFSLHTLPVSLNAVEVETYLTSRKALFSLFSLSSVSSVFTAGREAGRGWGLGVRMLWWWGGRGRCEMGRVWDGKGVRIKEIRFGGCEGGVRMLWWWGGRGRVWDGKGVRIKEIRLGGCEVGRMLYKMYVGGGKVGRGSAYIFLLSCLLPTQSSEAAVEKWTTQCYSVHTHTHTHHIINTHTPHTHTTLTPHTHTTLTPHTHTTLTPPHAHTYTYRVIKKKGPVNVHASLLEHLSRLALVLVTSGNYIEQLWDGAHGEVWYIVDREDHSKLAIHPHYQVHKLESTLAQVYWSRLSLSHSGSCCRGTWTRGASTSGTWEDPFSHGSNIWRLNVSAIVTRASLAWYKALVSMWSNRVSNISNTWHDTKH